MYDKVLSDIDLNPPRCAYAKRVVQLMQYDSVLSGVSFDVNEMLVLING
jgi:hypothetical protein